MTVFDRAFWRDLEQAGGGLTFLRSRIQTPPVLTPGDDADVIAGNFEGALAFLRRRGFLRWASANPDQYLMCWWPRGDAAPMYVDLYRSISWRGGWVWRGPMDHGWLSLAHGLIAKRDWRHFRRKFSEDDLAEAVTADGWRWLFDWSLDHGFRPGLWVLCARMGLRWSPTRWLRSTSLVWRRRLSRRRGLEIGFSGVDGSGKSSTVEQVARQAAFPTTVMYMGSRPGTFIGRTFGRVRYRGPGKGLVGAADLALRRLRGMVAAWRGQVVLYDRDPACRATRSGNAAVNGLYAPLRAVIERPVDLSVFLDGDVSAFWRRKGEHNLEILARLRDQTAAGYRDRTPLRIDSAVLALNEVTATVTQEIHARVRQRKTAVT